MAFPSQAAEPGREPLWRTAAGLLALIAVFVASGWPLIRRLGIEVDEAQIGDAIYERAEPWYSWHIFGNQIPIMLMTYLGAMKAWLFNAIFAIWPPGPVSLMLPTVVIAAFTIAMFFMLADRAVGRRAAWIATALLAMDPMFVVTGSLDFGPVVFQHAFKIGGLLLLVSFHRRPAAAKLAGAFFLFGLAIWDKALFTWILVALAIAGMVVFGREIRSHALPRNVGIAALAFVAGALPFIVYNIERPLETFRANARIAPDNPLIKLVMTKRTTDGSGLFGMITAGSPGPHPGEPHGLRQHSAFALSRMFGAPVTDLTGWAFVAALAAMPFVWRRARRPLAFSLLYLILTWLQMFFTAGAGGAVHHIVLLWPFHILFIAVVISELTSRVGRRGLTAAVVVTGILCFSELLVLNQYYVTLVYAGTGVRWTDAFSPLNAFLYETKARRIVTADWGILETLHLMSGGELPVEDASVALRSPDDPQSRDLIGHLLAADATIWVLHTKPAEQWPGVRATLVRFADSLGYAPELLETIQDRNGRPIFEIYRFRHA